MKSDKRWKIPSLIFFGEKMKTVVMLSGKMRSGKNTFADILIEEILKQSPNTKLKYDFFAKPVKDQCKDVFRNLTNYLNNISVQIGARELYTDDDNWYEDKNEITRILLQTYGTEIFRDKVDEEYWSKLMRENIIHSDQEIVIITDWRFKNEVNIIRESTEYKTITVRIERPELLIPVSDIHQHSSEKDLDDYNDFDHRVTNISISKLQAEAIHLTELILNSVNDTSR